jgi:hypothetical protein
MPDKHENHAVRMRERSVRLAPPSRFEIATAWEDNLRFVDSMDEPACFACGYVPNYSKLVSILRRWNESGLERAHIVAACEEGSNAPSNFLLLCKRCHCEAPMTIIPQILIDWATNREGWFAWYYRNAERAIIEAGIDEDFDGRQFKDFLHAVNFKRHPQETAEMCGLIPPSALAMIQVFGKMKNVFQNRGLSSSIP